jgi:Holliday junction resolvase RusA-like endonuclease
MAISEEVLHDYDSGDKTRMPIFTEIIPWRIQPAVRTNYRDFSKPAKRYHDSQAKVYEFISSRLVEYGFVESTFKMGIRKCYPLRLGVAVFINPGKSGPGKGTVPTNKGDWDNYYKAVADCLVYYKFLDGDNAHILRGPAEVYLPQWKPDSPLIESGVYPATFSPIGEATVFTLWRD